MPNFIISNCFQCRTKKNEHAPTDSRQSQNKRMPAAAGCSNCCTKYTLFNKEFGCPTCHLSFCKKCLSHMVILPGSSKQVQVCTRCYNKLIPQPNKATPASQAGLRDNHPQQMYPSVHSSSPATSTHGYQANPTGNWWGEGLPPPSFRNATNSQPWNNIQPRSQPQPPPTALDPLEKRLNEVRKIECNAEPPKHPPSLSELEERLAALRGCDVELVRNPRVWFDSKSDEPMESATVDGLLRMAEDCNRIEDNRDRDLEERWNKMKVNSNNAELPVDQDLPDADPTRFSTMSAVSGNTEFSEATKEELHKIDELMDTARKSVKQSPHPRPTEDDLNKEARSLLAETRQKSLEIDKVNSEIANFYNRRIDDVKLDDDRESSSSESLDEATLRQIMEEAERAEDENTANEVRQEMDYRKPGPTSSGHPSNSPSKEHKGILGKIFKR